MKTNGAWLRFNHEYLVWARRLSVEYMTPEVQSEVEEWLRSWLREDSPLCMRRKAGYSRSWMIRAIELVGERRAHELFIGECQ